MLYLLPSQFLLDFGRMSVVGIFFNTHNLGTKKEFHSR